ncbi:MAG: hypothetical protein WBB45_08830 [Cyclobacteriaceae bacterium]
MQSIISNMGTAYYDKVRDAIVFIFKEYSSIYTYRESLDLAVSLAVNHKTNNWFFDKTKFSKVLTGDIINELLDWGKSCCNKLARHDINRTCKVSVLTPSGMLTSHYFERLNEEIKEDCSINNTDIAFFKDRTDAENFLLTTESITFTRAEVV